MTIDERINQLSLDIELLRGMMPDVLAKIDKLAETSQTHDAALTRLENLIAPLVVTALSHEQRLRQLEKWDDRQGPESPQPAE